MVKFLRTAALVLMSSAILRIPDVLAQDADDPNQLENEVERTELGVIGRGVLAAENLAKEAENALDNEAIRDLDALKGELPPTRVPTPIPTPQDDDLEDIKREVETLERDAQSLK